MLCQNCQRADTTTHLKRITDGEYTEIHLCAECAAALGVTDVFPGFGQTFGSLLGAFPATDMRRVGNRVLRCETCGFTFDDVARTGKPGCPDCYRVFGEKLKPSLQKIHGRGAVHAGKIPNGAGEETLPEFFRLSGEGYYSHNHHMYGDIKNWFISAVAGLRYNPDGADRSRVLVQPAFIGGLDFAEASYDSPAGEITVRWDRKDGGVDLRVRIPEGISAEVALPDGSRISHTGDRTYPYRPAL